MGARRLSKLESLRERSEPVLLACKSGTKSFEAVLEVMEPYLDSLAKYYTNSKKYYIKEFDGDDYKQLVLLYLWQGIKTYRFTCVYCNTEAINEVMFLKHFHEKPCLSGKVAQPLFNYVRYYIGAYIRQEAIKRSFRKKSYRFEESLTLKDNTLGTIEDKSFLITLQEIDYLLSANLGLKAIREDNGDNLDEIIYACLVSGMTQYEIASALIGTAESPGIFPTRRKARKIVKRKTAKIMNTVEALREEVII